jgi:hypothetical protein
MIVFTIGREGVPERHPATRAEGKTIDMRRLIGGFRLRVVRAGNLGFGFANRQPSGDTSRGDILIEERRRDAQRRSDVVEPLDFDLGGQQRLRVELYAKQVVDRRAELGSRQTLDWHMPRHPAARGGTVERGLHPGHERVDLTLRRLTASGRRHQAAAQLAHRFFPDVGVLGDRVE